MQRFYEKIDKASDCWVWNAAVDKDGYGKFKMYGMDVKAHRVAWELHHGEQIPCGKIIMHCCDNPRCCNPDHLRIGTIADNNADRARKKRSFESQKTHCPHGHEYTEENTSWWKGQRKCKQCMRDRYYRRKSLAG